ncbi:tripartite tricarboxylate transporter substrate binding protein [Paramicrobacterium chengjingii]|uniref:Tripartite tricarboxylate transporter substrate binding protein n=1 Tax=Paramicrobacterium chengjingii TaxID=2769067 RepID=A0ABX6YFG3_9MICO|nr:tripartite tricarboxylate transporter substrate binding protein [Microbacterium chengjingii]QPZ37543.1 tripartite tricarboxylate transporter substrate binding protein [Microbacterium chengjingii]
MMKSISRSYGSRYAAGANAPISRQVRKKAGAAFAAFALVSVLAGCTSGSGGASDSGCDQIDLIVPYSPGGSSDTAGRSLAKIAEDESGITVNVINQPGANGTTAATKVAQKKPKACETIMLPNGPFTSMPFFQDVQFTPEDFAAVASLNQEDIVFVVNSGSGWTSLDDLASEKSHRFTYGTTGGGSYTQLAQAQTFDELGLDATGVPFEGNAPALTALLGNQVDAVAAHPGEVLQYVESGDLTAVAVFSEERSQYLKDVPTALEQDVDVNMSIWKGLYVNDELDESALTELTDVFEKAAASDEFLETLDSLYSARAATRTGDMISQLTKERKTNETLFEDLGLL